MCSSTTFRKRSADLLEVVGGKTDVLLDVGIVLYLLELLVEQLVGHAQGHLAEELDEAAIGVIAEAGIAGLADLALQGLAC